MNKAEAAKIVAVNRKATHDYSIEKKLECGLVLKGSEVKSIRLGKVQLVDSYASIERNQVYLYKAHISEYKQGGPYFNHDPIRKRKILLHRKEIRQLGQKLQAEGYTLIPLKVYLKRGMVKLELGLAKGKTKGDKRQSLKSKDARREIDRTMKRQRS